MQFTQQNMNKENLISLEKRHSTDAKTEMTKISKLFGTNIKAAIIKILQQVRRTSWNEWKGRNIIKEIQSTGSLWKYLN